MSQTPDIELIETLDGSQSLYSSRFGEPYHSRHGAVQESRHVFIRMGWQEAMIQAPESIRIMEMGMGTGLNVLLTWAAWAQRERQPEVHYHTWEAYPLDEPQWSALGYGPLVAGEKGETVFRAIHKGPWEQAFELESGFWLTKYRTRLEDASLPEGLNLVYFDAFAPESQPELWTEVIFSRIHAACAPGALLTTYCAKGAVRRAMLAAGFSAERLPGPPGKREMLRARA